MAATEKYGGAMFSGLLVAIAIGGAMYLGWNEADPVWVFLLALILYIPSLQSNNKKAITAFNGFRSQKTLISAIKALTQTLIVPYGSALLTVCILFFVAMWVS
jgi:hypothetical protein